MYTHVHTQTHTRNIEVFATSEQQCEEDLMFLLELAATDANLLVRYEAFIT